MLALKEIKKTALLFLADPKPIAAGIIAPTAILIIFCLIFGSFTSITIGIIDNDQSQMSGRLEEEILSQVSPLGNVPYFKKKEIPGDEPDILELIKSGEFSAVIEIPGGFSKDVARGTYPVIKYYLNNFNSDFGKNLRLYLQEGIVSYYSQYYRQYRISVTEKHPAQVQWVEIIASGSFFLATIIGGMFLYLYLFFKEKDYNTLLFYKLSPKSPFSSFAARIGACWLFSIVTAVINIALAWLLTGKNFFVFFDRILPVLSAASLYYIALAVIVSLFAKNFYASAMAVMFGAILSWFISGGMSTVQVEITSVTGFIAHILPNMYALNLIRYYTLDLPLKSVTSNILVLTGMAVVFSTISFIVLNYKTWYPGKK